MEEKRLRIFPLSTVLFPGAPLNLHIFEPRYLQMISECLDRAEPFGVVLIKEGEEAGDPDVTPFDVGTAARITDVTTLDRGRLYVSTVGSERFRITRIVSREPFIVADVVLVQDGEQADQRAAAEIEHEVRMRFAEYRRLLVAFSVFAADADLPQDSAEASFVIADALQISDAIKQRLLEMTSHRERLVMELGMLRRLLPQLESMVERRRLERKRRESKPDAVSKFRSSQESLFGKYFSEN